MIHFVVAFLVLAAPQVETNNPSLTETFEWMSNTLSATEYNNVSTHHPTPRPYVKEWVDKEIDPYHRDTITRFSHDGCTVTFEVDTVDNDMGLLLGKVFYYHSADTFDLKDIDPQSVRIEDSCKPVETSTGPVEPWNCEDIQGKILVLQTVDPKPKIYEEGHGSSGKSRYGYWQVSHHEKLNLDKMCKEFPGNEGYCDQPDAKQEPKELTSTTFGFSTPEYAKRFAEAVRHAVELCGGKSSAF